MQTYFVELLKDILSSAETEMIKIQGGENTLWTKEALQMIVIPEITELLDHAIDGKVFYKFGEQQRLLESTYYMNDSLANLHNTTLGKKVSKLQELYFKL